MVKKTKEQTENVPDPKKTMKLQGPVKIEVLTGAGLKVAQYAAICSQVTHVLVS